MRGYLLAPECFDEKMVCQQERRHAQPNARARRAIRALGQPGPQLRRRGPAREVAQQAVQVHQVAQAITHVLVAEQMRRAEQDHISHEGAAGLESRALHKPKPAAGGGSVSTWSRKYLVRFTAARDGKSSHAHAPASVNIRQLRSEYSVFFWV
jgi:hypothetical protein